MRFSKFFCPMKIVSFCSVAIASSIFHFEPDVTSNLSMKNNYFNLSSTFIRKAFSLTFFAFLSSFLLLTPASADEIIRAKIKSEILGQEREIIIHLPKNYDSKSKKKYPVMYALDGGSLSNPVAARIGEISANGKFPEMIVVGIPNMTAENRQKDLLPPYMKIDLEVENSPFGRGDKFLAFIETELMPYIKNNYKTSGLNAISGHSRGAVLVLYSLFAKPDLFQARFAYSPAVWREDNLLISKTKDFFVSAKKMKSFWYMSLGDQENDKMKGGFEALTEVLKNNASKKMIWHAYYIKDSNHQDNAKLSIPQALEKWGEYLKR